MPAQPIQHQISHRFFVVALIAVTAIVSGGALAVLATARSNNSKIPLPADGTTITWSQAQDLIHDCQVTHAFQNHQNEVYLQLKNKAQVTTTQPQIDMLIDIVLAADKQCPGTIPIATE